MPATAPRNFSLAAAPRRAHSSNNLRIAFAGGLSHPVGLRLSLTGLSCFSREQLLSLLLPRRNAPLQTDRKMYRAELSHRHRRHGCQASVCWGQNALLRKAPADKSRASDTKKTWAKRPKRSLMVLFKTPRSSARAANHVSHFRHRQQAEFSSQHERHRRPPAARRA